ncbi:MAG: S-adenosylmethionine:tRNA ribosyltransferase-isomerase [Cyclobacteriaceae bacterium]|nr:S-adenosylmethionine:tRNA ribosyltransferase-isomerase [Cyclobacteriaceae bacterium]
MFVKNPRFTLEAYDYQLPEEKIARFPLRERDQSKLLVSRGGKISHEKFFRIPDLLPEKSFLVFNETRVIPARLEFKKNSGAMMEIFLLDPVFPSNDAAMVMKSQHEVIWHCMIKNSKKWKGNIHLEKKLDQFPGGILLKANIVDREKNLIRISWDPGQITFGEIIESAGKVPLPPYLKREPVSEDRERYQTIYSKNEGAVAAPTAGLHFTGKVLDQLVKKGFHYDFLTLHVGAGTFQPIRHNDIRKHPMHSEQISFTARNILNLLTHHGPVIAVGTTSMRTLESLYWYGVKLIEGSDMDPKIDSLFPYRFNPLNLPSREEALQGVLKHMEKIRQDEIFGETEIFIFPGYPFRICDGLITNFHMPKSSLLLLVSAFIGDHWSEVYKEALENDYRFLSYGDSSLLFP